MSAGGPPTVFNTPRLARLVGVKSSNGCPTCRGRLEAPPPAASDAADLQLKNKELEIKETGQLIDMLKSTGQSKSREQQSQLNRESKEAIKEAEIQAKLKIEETKIDLDQRKELAKYMSEMLKKQMEDQKEIDQTAIENMLKVANQQITEMRNDAER